MLSGLDWAYVFGEETQGYSAFLTLYRGCKPSTRFITLMLISDPWQRWFSSPSSTSTVLPASPFPSRPLWKEELRGPHFRGEEISLRAEYLCKLEFFCRNGSICPRMFVYVSMDSRYLFPTSGYNQYYFLLLLKLSQLGCWQPFQLAPCPFDKLPSLWVFCFVFWALPYFWH